MSKRPTVLMILDGYGLNNNQKGNAVAEAKTPVVDKIKANRGTIDQRDRQQEKSRRRSRGMEI